VSALKQASNEAQRVLALLGYALLFFGVLTAGVSALAAVLLASGQRESASAVLRSHFDGQIRIFWRTFWSWMIALAVGVDSFVLAVNSGFGVDLSKAEIIVDDPIAQLALWALLGAIVVAALGLIYCLFASGLGFIRLASADSIGETGDR
jgi:uncharacterized membrane protein